MARQLVWTQQPTMVTAGEPIAPAPIVEIQRDGALDYSVVNGEMTVRIESGPTGGSLVGKTSVPCPLGIATFDDIGFTVPGEYSLRAVCDESSIEERWPGIDGNTPGMVARYRGVSGIGLVDMLGTFPTLPYKGSGTVEYGLPTPMGPIGVKASSGEFVNENATFPFDMAAVCLLAFIHHPGMVAGREGFLVFGGFRLSGQSQLVTAEGRVIAHAANSGLIRPRFYFWSGSASTSAIPTTNPISLQTGHHLLALQFEKSAPTSARGMFYHNGKFISGLGASNTYPDSVIWSRSSIRHLVTQLGGQQGTGLVELVILNRSLTAEEHADVAKRYGVAM